MTSAELSCSTDTVHTPTQIWHLLGDIWKPILGFLWINNFIEDTERQTNAESKDMVRSYRCCSLCISGKCFPNQGVKLTMAWIYLLQLMGCEALASYFTFLSYSSLAWETKIMSNFVQLLMGSDEITHVIQIIELLEYFKPSGRVGLQNWIKRNKDQNAKIKEHFPEI